MSTYGEQRPTRRRSPFVGGAIAGAAFTLAVAVTNPQAGSARMIVAGFLLLVGVSASVAALTGRTSS